jgi:2,3-bisphosphoglycerate-dependent phosphoglycerate mutase
MGRMEATRIIAVRHGETPWNVDARIQGQLDIQLNDTGRWQARRVGHALTAEQLAAVYSSDLGRAHETARAIGDAARLDVVAHPGLRERVTRTMSDLAARHRGEQIAVVAHGGVLDTLYRIATGQEVNSPRTWQLPNGAINRLLWTPEGFTLIGWSDTQHLDHASFDENTSF